MTLDLFRHDLVVSIKPEYATKIVVGDKKVELRRRFPYGTVTGARMYIYASSPIQAVIGYAVIRTVERLSPSEIWSRYASVAYITSEDFQSYYRDVSLGYVLVLEHPVRLKTPVHLSVLKEKLSFSPPQSFAYADDTFKKLVDGQSQ